jgi:hemerythrin-like domain-containing protein
MASPTSSATPLGAPTLLNDDGSASMATAFLMSHHGFRRDLARFALALERLVGGDQDGAAALREQWQGFHEKLHGHHMAEDNGIFPGMKTEVPALAPIIDGLAADHRQLDQLLAAADRAFAGLPGTTADAKDVIAQVRQLLDRHLPIEEARLVPFMRGATAFPTPSSDAEAELYAKGFAWAFEGVAPEVLAKLDTMLPEILRARLPAAREEYAATARRAWGPTPPGASTKAIPDWLPGG